MRQIAYLIPKTFAGKAALFGALYLIIYLFSNGLLPRIISWDVYGYYLYLPQTFIHGDLGLDNFDTVTHALNSNVESATFYQAAVAESGNWVMKYPMGLAIFYFPFFLIGLLVSWIGGYPVDGFALPSQYSMTLGSVFYMCLGLWLTTKILSRFFSDRTAGIAILAMVFGTNYYQIHTGSHCMPHIYLFAGYAVLIWFTIRWYETKKIKLALGIGLVIGLLTLSRPTELMSVIIPMFYGIKSLDHIGQRLIGALKYFKHILLMGLGVVIMLLPQLIYWKVYAGSWLYDSYNNPGEGLDLLDPNLFNFLFSYRKGWLLYTPMMFLSLIGIVWAIRSKRPWLWATVLFTICYIYVSSCWSSWWYATSFSQRTMVQAYPLLIIPIAYFIEDFRKGIGKRLLLFFGVIALIGLNIFQTVQYHRGIIDASRMTEKYYWKVFLDLSPEPGADKYLLVNRSTTTIEDISAFQTDYYCYSSQYLIDQNGAFKGYPELKSGHFSTVLPGQVSAKYEMAFSDLSTKDHAWIIVTGKVHSSANLLNQTTVTSTFAHKNKAYKYRVQGLDSYITKEEKDFKEFSIMYLTPEIRSESDPFQFYMINNSEQDTLTLFDVKVDVYQRSAIYE